MLRRLSAIVLVLFACALVAVIGGGHLVGAQMAVNPMDIYTEWQTPSTNDDPSTLMPFGFDQAIVDVAGTTYLLDRNTGAYTDLQGPGGQGQVVGDVVTLRPAYAWTQTAGGDLFVYEPDGTTCNFGMVPSSTYVRYFDENLYTRVAPA